MHFTHFCNVTCNLVKKQNEKKSKPSVQYLKFQFSLKIKAVLNYNDSRLLKCYKRPYAPYTVLFFFTIIL